MFHYAITTPPTTTTTTTAVDLSDFTIHAEVASKKLHAVAKITRAGRMA